MGGYIGTKGQIRSGISATIDELDILDGATVTTAELNYNDTGAAVGTVVASKTVTADANKDVASFRNITATGTITGGGLTLPDGSINIADLDIDGGTDIGAALVDADLMVVDDGAGGTNRKATMSRLATYMGTKIGGGLEFISSIDVSNAATASFTGFDSSKYDSYLFSCANVVPATNGTLLCMRMSVDDGSNYLSASDSYTIIAAETISVGDATLIPINYYSMSNTSTTGGLSGNITVNGPQINARTYMAGFIMSTQDAAAYGGVIQDEFCGGATKAATVVNAVQFLFNSGNITSGTITMYGLVNS